MRLNNPEGPATVRVEELYSYEEVLQLSSEWRELWNCCPSGTPFQRPEWLLTWWRFFRPERVRCLAMRVNERLVGLAPFCLELQDGRSELRLMGGGVSDYLDALLEPEHAAASLSALAAHLVEGQDLFDGWDFEQLRRGSPLLELVPPDGWVTQLTVQEVCPAVALPGDVAGLQMVVPKHMLQKLAYYRRRLAAISRAAIEQAEASNFDELFTSFLASHRARWAARGQNGKAIQDFHREVAEGMLEAGMLRLYALRIEGHIRAALYGFAGHERTFFYLAGFDPEIAPLSPGTLLIGHALEQSLLVGARCFDFLRGREAYKYLWGAKGQLNYRRKASRARGREEAPVVQADAVALS